MSDVVARSHKPVGEGKVIVAQKHTIQYTFCLKVGCLGLSILVCFTGFFGAPLVALCGKQDAEAKPISGASKAARDDQRGVGAGEGEEDAHRHQQERESHPQAR